MTISIWVCQEHYDELCKLAGYELPIMVVHNSFHYKCSKCEKTAEHLIDEPAKKTDAE